MHPGKASAEGAKPVPRGRWQCRRFSEEARAAEGRREGITQGHDERLKDLRRDAIYARRWKKEGHALARLRARLWLWARARGRSRFRGVRLVGGLALRVAQVRYRPRVALPATEASRRANLKLVQRLVCGVGEAPPEPAQRVSLEAERRREHIAGVAQRWARGLVVLSAMRSRHIDPTIPEQVMGRVAGRFPRMPDGERALLRQKVKEAVAKKIADLRVEGRRRHAQDRKWKDDIAKDERSLKRRASKKKRRKGK